MREMGITGKGALLFVSYMTQVVAAATHVKSAFAIAAKRDRREFDSDGREKLWPQLNVWE